MSRNSFVFETSLFVPALLQYLICPSLDPPHGIKFLIIRMKEDMGPCCGWHKNQLQNVSSFSFFPLPPLQSKPAGGSCHGLLSGPPTSHALPAYPISQSVQSLSRVQLFATAAHQASLSNTNPRSLPKLMSIELVMPSTHLILCHPLFLHLQSFPASGSFQRSQLFTSGGQSIGVSASTSVLPMNTQDWSLLGWTAWISLQSKGLSRVFSSTTVQRHQFFIGPCFYHQSHPQQGVVFALAPSLHSFWSYFSTDLQ